jgi:two-component system sensor histidine kinase KdpD
VDALYVPLQTPGRRLGVIGVRPEPRDRFGEAGQRRLLESMVDQAAVALERTDLADAARRAHLETEAERLRTSLLTSLSHDMRTPLGAIQGAASALLSEGLGFATQRSVTHGDGTEESRRGPACGEPVDSPARDRRLGCTRNGRSWRMSSGSH